MYLEGEQHNTPRPTTARCCCCCCCWWCSFMEKFPSFTRSQRRHENPGSRAAKEEGEALIWKVMLCENHRRPEAEVGGNCGGAAACRKFSQQNTMWHTQEICFPLVVQCAIVSTPGSWSFPLRLQERSKSREKSKIGFVMEVHRCLFTRQAASHPVQMT